MALLLLATPVHGSSEKLRGNVQGDIGRTITGIMTGPSIVWNSFMKNDSVRSSITKSISDDVSNKIPFFSRCKVPSVEDDFVNATGYFVTIRFVYCTESDSNDYTVNQTYSTTTTYINSLLQSTYVNMSLFWGDTVTTFSQTYMLPGTLPTPLPPGIVNATIDNQIVMLSGDSVVWKTVMTDYKKLSSALISDLAQTIGHSGDTATCAINSIAVHTADPTKTLPGDGNDGLTVELTITQTITNLSTYMYNMHQLSAVLGKATMTATSALYNTASGGKTHDLVHVVAAYEDVPYSVLECASACIIALTLLVSVVYLMIIMIIVTIVATQCYLINDFGFDDLLKARFGIY